MYELPDFLKNIKPVPTEHQEKYDRLNRLEEEYFEKFKDDDWDSWSNDIPDDELIEALAECLKRGKPMRKIRPQWCGKIPKNCKT